MRDQPPRLCLQDEVWARLAELIPGRRRCKGVCDLNARRFVDALLWILRTGAPWRDLPAYFGKWNTIYQRFRRWALAGVWQVVQVFLLMRRELSGTVFLDSTILRAHQHAAGAPGGADRHGIGLSRGGRSTKIHVVVDDMHTLLGWKVTPGQSADISSAPALLKLTPHAEDVVGDRGYDADAFVHDIQNRGATAVIPARRRRRCPRTYDRQLYGRRNHVERFFLHMKQQRRLATRYEKTVPSLVAALCLDASVRMARQAATA